MRVIQVTLSEKSPKIGVIKTFTDGKPDEYLYRIKKEFRTINPARFHVKKHLRKRLPAYLYAVRDDGRFRVGLLAEIYNFVKEDLSDENYSFQVSDEFKRVYEPSFALPANYRLHDFSKTGKGYQYRDVQEEGIKRIFNRGRGIIQVGTAGGKGLVMASVIRTLHDYNPTFTFTVIVPTHLIRKTIDEFRDEYGITNISGWGDKLKPDFTKRVVVVGPNALSVADSETIEKIDRNVCMVDECHLVNESSKLGKIIDNYITTPNLVGLTGSLSDKQMDKWRCIGTIGKIVYHVTSEELREKGYKARSRVVAIKFVNHHYRPEFPEPEKDQPSLYLQERDFILKNDARNVMIAKFVKRMCGRNTLIPVDLNEYQEIIVPILENITERPVWVIDGDTPSEERMRIYKTMESVDDVILVAKVGCLREGISINNLHYIAMPWIQKSFIRIVQLLGRAERLKDGGEEALIFDFNDDTTYSTKHFERRCEIYEQEKVPIINQKLDIRTFVDN